MILVVGATGYLGEKVAERLLLSGEQVRTLVRPGAATDVLVAAGAEIVHGDLKDPASLDAATRPLTWECAGPVPATPRR